MTDNVIPFPPQLRAVPSGKPSATSFDTSECPEAHARAYLDLLKEWEPAKPRFGVKPDDDGGTAA